VDANETYQGQPETTDETTTDDWPTSTANQSRTRI
jgi:hypothetical protein